jgi:hypothetical protein
MNRYAQIALEQHRRLRPLEHLLIEDPTRFFTEIGAQMQAEVTSLRDEILGPPRPNETPEEYRIRGYQALATAEEMVLADHYLFQSETDEAATPDEADPDLDRYFADLAAINQTIHTS